MSSPYAQLWALRPDVDFLNHGSFGATPREVLAAQAAYRVEMEAEPVSFLARRLGGMLDDVRATLAGYLRADVAGLVLVPNASTGVSTVLASTKWSPGDEILMCDQTYNAVKQMVFALADRHGVVPVECRAPFPLRTADELVEAYASGINPRTRLVIVDHVSSPTGIVFPVARIVALARAAGVPVLVDGAHAPGFMPLDLDALDADFYTGNLHKWLCAPKGAAFLWLRDEWRVGKVRPLVVSHGYRMGLAAEFNWLGTVDPTAWLAVPAAIAFAARFPEAAEWNHALVREGRRRVAAALDVELPHPDDRALYGSMAAVPVPQAGRTDFAVLSGLNEQMYRRHRIEVPFMGYDGRVFVRISGQLYNAPEQYERLARALQHMDY